MTDIFSRIQSAYLELPSAVREALSLSATAPAFFSAEQVNHYCQQTGESRVQLGLSLLPLATAFAEAPVSHFSVGAVAFDSAGNAYLGANFEFAGGTHCPNYPRRTKRHRSRMDARGAGFSFASHQLCPLWTLPPVHQ